jgi:hypothetical protein
MNLICFPLLGTCSKRAILRKAKPFGLPYNYRPQITLIKRLSLELGLTIEQTLSQLLEEHKYLTK